MSRALALILALLGALPAAAQQVPNPMAKDGSNAKLPWTLTAPNDQHLGQGVTIKSGYTGPLMFGPGFTGTTPTWGLEIQYGATCQDHYIDLFSKTYLSGSFGLASCATSDPASTVSQFNAGMFSVQASNADKANIGLIAQTIAKGDNTIGMGINTVNSDSYNIGDSSSASIAGTTLTVGGTITGTFNPGDWIIGSAAVTPGTYIIKQLTGTTGGAGTYQLNFASTSPAGRLNARKFLENVLVQNEFDHFCVNPDTSCRSIIAGYFPNGEQASVEGATLGGTVTVGDQLQLTITDATVVGSPRTVSYTTIGGDTLATAAAGLAQAINSDANLQAQGFIGRSVDNVVRIYYPFENGALPRPITFAKNVTGAATETITLALIKSGNDARFAMQVGAGFAGATARWQTAYRTAQGGAYYALGVGRMARLEQDPVLGDRSQAIRFSYTDNTTAGITRNATMYVDPAGAGATGVDMVFSNNSGQATNISLPFGSLSVANAGSSSLFSTSGNSTTLQTTVGSGNDHELIFQKARVGPSIIAAGDDLGTIRFRGYDGSAYVDGVVVTGDSGTIAAGNVGGFLRVYTNGTERARIGDTGLILLTPPTTGTAAGSLCIDAAGVVYKKTTAGACL